MSFDRLRLALREGRSLLAGVERERRDPTALALLLGSVLAGGLWVASVYALPSDVQGSKVFEVLASALTTVLAVVFSVDYVAPYLKRTERRRIARPDAVVDAHDRSPDFLDVPGGDGAVGRFRGYDDALPVAVEYLPASPTPVDEVRIRDDGGFYDFPESVRATLGPERERFEALFRRERLHSELLSRVASVEADGTHVVERTSYYRSFVTNFCPDLALTPNATPRDLLGRFVFDRDGRVRPLADSPLSDHLGGGCLLVRPDGRVVLARRSEGVSIEKRTLSLSFSGSFDVHDATLTEALADEAVEELGVSSDAVRSLTYLGTVRRVERLGKPDVVSVGLLADEAHIDTDSPEVADVVEVETGVSPTTIDGLFEAENVRAVVEAVLTAVDDADVPPAIDLLTVLALLERRAGDRTNV